MKDYAPSPRTQTTQQLTQILRTALLYAILLIVWTVALTVVQNAYRETEYNRGRNHATTQCTQDSILTR